MTEIDVMVETCDICEEPIDYCLGHGFEERVEALLVEEVYDWQHDAFRAWVKSGGYVEDGDGLPSVSDFEEQYQGEFSSWSEFVEMTFTDLGCWDECPEHLRPYLDVEKWGRDLRFDHSTLDAPAGGIYVFRAW